MADGPAPVEAWAHDDNGNDLGTVLVWIKYGQLSALEYGWVTEARPRSWPPPRLIRLKS